jgi:hypothetical protein
VIVDSYKSSESTGNAILIREIYCYIVSKASYLRGI